jgi:hypothetical protein
MVDIKDRELSVGDKVLVAFTSCGNCHMEYATITSIDDSYTFKVRFDTNVYFRGKTRTVHIYNSKMLKIDEGH